VTYLTDRLEACEADLRGGLGPDERVVAVGRAEDITLRGDIDAGGGGWTFVMVTDRHLRWVPRVRLRYATALELDGVTDALDRTSAHRYAISLRHPAIYAVRDVPAHRLFGFAWGNTEAVRMLRVSILAFSRRDTVAARALRAELARRRVVPRTIPSPPRKPRPGPVYLTLRPTER
jgi:hypothetical protein